MKGGKLVIGKAVYETVIFGDSCCFEGMKPGVRKVEAQLYPSTYNSYGPHHHRDGDRHLISPMQYEGQKNFADFADSPEDTLISQWNFVKFGIGKESN